MLKRFLSRQKGATLIELVVSVSILAIVSGSLLTALSTGIFGGVKVEDRSSAANLATAQMEDTLAQSYEEPPEYPILTTPERYSATSESYVEEPTLLQTVTVTISNTEETLLEITTRKVNDGYQASPPSLLLSQRDFRWYENTDALTPVTSLAEENSPYTIRDLNQVYRLRMSMQINVLPLLAGEQDFKLQFATSTDGPWNDVGGIDSTGIWRGYDNPTPADGTTLPSLLLSYSDIMQSYEEANPSVTNPNAVALGEWAEWDWVVQENGASYNTNYYFRMANSDGTAFGSYTRYPLIIMPPPLTLTQYDYRWYGNTDSINPTSPLASEHTAYTATTHGLIYRLRMNVGVDGINLQAGSLAFKLQYATDTGGPWTDVGAAGSGEIWRGYDNATPADGTTLTSLLLANSDVLGSYEEQNPSVTNPNTIDVDEYGEWDWVIEDNGAADSTAYYFRMVEDDGSALDSYTYYPQLTTPPPLSLTQQDYRWYENADSTTPTTALASENTAYSGATQPTVYHLRMNVEVDGAVLTASSQAFKLQYATDTGGPWTDVGDIGSGEIWRGYNNASPADGATIISLVLTNSDVLESYEEENPSVANPNAIDIDEYGEWGWVVQDNGASGSTTYYFRMVKSDGNILDGYTRYPEITTAARTLTQQDYRWYRNTDSITPTTPLAGENTAYVATTHGLVYRIRINVEIGNVWLLTGTQAFKLQYSTSTGGPWTDVGAAGSGAIWRGYDNGTPADGATLTSLLLTNSDILESYEEQNPSVANPNAINVSELGEWDWVVEDNGAADSTAYYFRMVESDGTALDTYNNYPRIDIPAALTMTQQDYRWYENADSITPTTPLASENTAYSGAIPLTVYRIRMNIELGSATLLSAIQAFKLQYATDTGGPWTDVGATGSGEIWRGYDNGTPADGATLTSLLLANSDILESYEEQNPSVANPNAINAGQYGEWDWVVQNNGASGSTTYYFRMVESDGTALDTYTRYPQITTAYLSYTQDDYRWYENTDGITPTTPLAGENTAYVATTHDLVYRIRLNVQVGGLDVPASAQIFKLQYSTSTVGPWTDVGDISSGEIWRGYDNASPADGATLTSLLLTNSDVLESYEEQNPSVANPNAISIGERGEWDWVIEDNGAADSTTYYFRMVKSDDTALDTYNNYPRIDIPATLTMTQQDYRWYDNVDSITPTTPLASENTAYSGATPLTVYRIRMNVAVGGATLLAGIQDFKLQYAIDTGGPWTDVGAAGSGAIWRGYDNATLADGATLTSLLLAASDVLESYEEENPSVANPNAIAAGQEGEWDWVIQNNVALGSTTYYFRVVESDGTALDSYANYPQITTTTLTFTQQDYHWYANRNNITPNTSLTGGVENTPYDYPTYAGAIPLEVYRIRMNVGVGGTTTLPASALSFKLQYSTDTGGPWTDVGAIDSAEIWRGYDNTNVADGATITSLLLSSSEVLGSYEEENPSVLNPNAITTGQEGEWDWVIQNNTAPSETTYYFRMVRADGTVLDTYTNYPQIETAPLTFSQEDYRWYENRDNDDPNVPLAAENTACSSTALDAVYRLRMNVEVGGVDLPADAQAFKLQYSTSTLGPWTDVGAIGSGVIWRGYDNPTPVDGESTGLLSLTASDVRQTYEEENPSVANIRAINIGQRGEWDWVLEDNGLPYSTTYYFRMVKDDGTALDTYTRYPQLTTAAPRTFTQQDYRWYENRDNDHPDTPLAAENSTYTATAHGEVYQIRMNVEVGEADLPAASQAFKLQYREGLGGTWTDVGAIGSGAIWRGYDNPTPADGDIINATLLLSTSDVRESYEEENPSVANLNAIDVAQLGEWGWVVENNNAAASTDYYFRMVLSDGTAFDTYTNYPQLTTAAARTFTQQDYRWYENRNSKTPNTPLANQNTTYTATAHGEVYRIRMNVEVGGADLTESVQAFKLQYATDTGGPWTDVGAIGSGEIWRGYDNASPTDGDSVTTTLLLTTSDIRGTYEEENPSAVNPYAISIGQLGEWDWVVQNNGAATSTAYYFRMVESDGTDFDSYTNYPQLTTAPPLTFTQQEYRWYANRDNRTPDTPLADENTAFGAASTGTVYRIRMNVEVGGVDLADDAQAFKLQYATDTGGPWTDVGDIGSGAIWRGFDNPGVTDGQVVAVALLLSTSDIRESYEEENPSIANINAISIGQLGEWDWVIQDNNADPDTTYYFRMVESDGTAFDTYTRYPEITTIPPVIAWDNFESAGWSGGGGWLDAWYHEGDASIVSNGSPYEGSYHLRLRRATGYVDRMVDLSGKTSVQLQFWAKAKSFEAGETATCSISSNGTDWTVVHTWVDGDDDNAYHFFDIDLSSYSLTSTFWIAFDAEMSGTSDYLWIDDLKLVGQ